MRFGQHLRTGVDLTRDVGICVAVLDQVFEVVVEQDYLRDGLDIEDPPPPERYEFVVYHVSEDEQDASAVERGQFAD